MKDWNSVAPNSDPYERIWKALWSIREAIGSKCKSSQYVCGSLDVWKFMTARCVWSVRQEV